MSARHPLLIKYLYTDGMENLRYTDAEINFARSDRRPLIPPSPQPLPSPEGYDQAGFAIPSEDFYQPESTIATEVSHQEQVHLYR